MPGISIRFAPELQFDYAGIRTLERRGGLKAIRKRATKKPFDVSIAIVATVDDAKFLYGFRIGSGKAGEDSPVKVKEEIFYGDRPGLPSFRRHDNSFELSDGLSSIAIDQQGLALPLMAVQNKYLMFLWRKLCAMRTYNPAPEMIGQEWPIGDRPYLTRDARNTADLLRNVQDDVIYQHWIMSHLSEITPGLIDVRTETTETGRRVIYFDQEAGTDSQQTFAANLMSAGTLRALAVLVALYQKPPPTLLFIDEIEDSIHPAAMSVLIDAILEITKKHGQAIITSHNTDALNHKEVTGERVRVLDWQHGTSRIFALRGEVIEHIKPPESVGRLLRTNSLWKAEKADTVPDLKFFKI